MCVCAYGEVVVRELLTIRAEARSSFCLNMECCYFRMSINFFRVDCETDFTPTPVVYTNRFLFRDCNAIL